MEMVGGGIQLEIVGGGIQLELVGGLRAARGWRFDQIALRGAGAWWRRRRRMRADDSYYESCVVEPGCVRTVRYSMILLQVLVQ